MFGDVTSRLSQLVGPAIAATEPFAVDTASGTEASPGVKDPDRLQAFFDAVAATAPPEPEPDPDAADATEEVPSS